MVNNAVNKQVLEPKTKTSNNNLKPPIITPSTEVSKIDSSTPTKKGGKKKFYDPLLSKKNDVDRLVKSDSNSISHINDGNTLNEVKIGVSDKESSSKILSKVKPSRSNDSISDIATGLPHSPIDRNTGRKHQPIYSQSKSFDVCGSESSILNIAFKDAIFELKQSPQWLTNGSSIKERFSDDFLITYYNYVGRIISVRTILLNFVYFYDDYHKNGSFKGDKVMTSLLSPFFTTFIPRKRAFTAPLEDLGNNLSNFFLPGYFVKEIEDMFKITSLPYHGFETLIFDSILINVPESVFSRNYKFNFNDKPDCVINFPFDPRIMDDYNKTTGILINIMNYLNQIMVSSCSYNGEFNDVHSLFKMATPDWSITVINMEDYVYTKHLSDSDKINLLNTPIPSLDRVNVFSLSYNQFIDNTIFNNRESVLTKLSYLYSSNPLFTTGSQSVIVDDLLASDYTRPVLSRVYDNPTLWHDTIGGFNLEAKNLVHFNIPFRVNFDSSNKPNTTFISEPGFMTFSNDANGLNLIYGFVGSFSANSSNAINIYPNMDKVEIFDYFGSIGRRTGHLYNFNNYDVGNDINSYFNELKEEGSFSKFVSCESIHLSHPTLRRVSLDFNLVSSRLFDHFKEVWTSKHLVDLFSSKNTIDNKSVYNVYRVSDVNFERINK